MSIQTVNPKSNSEKSQSIGHSRRINSIADIVKARSYLEIGVEAGNTFLNVSVANKVAVDPNFRIDQATQDNLVASGHQLFEHTSDEFFRQWDSTNKFDLILIDGLHTFTQTLRDFTNSLSVSHSNTVWVIDDVLPTNYASVAKTQMEFQRLKNVDPSIPSGWYGDTYKILFFIESYFSNYSMKFFGGRRGQVVVFNNPNKSLTDESLSNWLGVEDICDVDFSAFQLCRNRSFPEKAEHEVIAELDALLGSK